MFNASRQIFRLSQPFNCHFSMCISYFSNIHMSFRLRSWTIESECRKNCSLHGHPWFNTYRKMFAKTIWGPISDSMTYENMAGLSIRLVHQSKACLQWIDVAIPSRYPLICTSSVCTVQWHRCRLNNKSLEQCKWDSLTLTRTRTVQYS